MNTFPPPAYDTWLVRENPTADPSVSRYLYRVPVGSQPRGHAAGTDHLTNALHDAGWYVARQRRKEAKRCTSGE